MLDNKGFDLWADGYDKAVGVSDEEDSYPFAGYKRILAAIFGSIMTKPKASVLDIGFGTGTLAARLYEEGCTVYGQDFSARMIELASAKMPLAHFYQEDFSKGLVEPLRNRQYDFIVATYSLHHLSDPEKVRFLHTLTCLLKEDGKILIGDVCFETREELNRFRQEAGDLWDDEEIYFVVEELKQAFPGLQFERFSCCAGILSLSR